MSKARMASYIQEASNAMSDYWVKRGVIEPMSQEGIDRKYTTPSPESA
jgi:hypothetical protein